MSKEVEKIMKVRCTNNKDHIIEVNRKIIEGSDEEGQTSRSQVYCVRCDKNVSFMMKGKIVPDKKVNRGG